MALNIPVRSPGLLGRDEVAKHANVISNGLPIAIRHSRNRCSELA